MRHHLARIQAILVTAVVVSSHTFAGQIPSHVYTALHSRQFLSGAARLAVESNLDAYLNGAQGPDTTGVVMPGLNTLSWFNAVGSETHYDPKKAELALNLLDCAKTDREIAWALGWLTHYINDRFVHEVVNNYGGYYLKDHKRHILLEQLENKHVLATHPEVVTHMAKPVPAAESDTFPGFIFDAYHKTWPDNKIYQSGNEWLVENRPYFCKRYNEAASWSGEGGQRFLQSHLSGTGKHGYGIAALPFPNMPSNDEYALMQQALEIRNIEAHPDHLTVTVRVNDNRLFGRFTKDWDRAAQDAIMYANQVFTFASAYLAEKDPTRKAELRAELLSVIPDQNLDQPLNSFDPDKAFPGNATIDKVTYILTLYPKDEPGKPAAKSSVISGTSGPIQFTGKGYSDARTGDVTFNIDLPAGSAPYRYTLAVALSGKDAVKVPEYVNVDWVQAEGRHPGTWLTGAAEMIVTDIIEVSLPLPESLRKQTKAQRRWIITPRGYSLTDADVALIQTRLPRDGFRYDVVPIEEKIENGVLKAKLQLTKSSPFANLPWGAQSLMMIWFPEGKGEQTISDVLADASKELEDANKAMEDVDAIMADAMTEEQMEQFGKEIMAYEEELTKKGVPEAEREKLLAKRAEEIMRKAGVDMEKLKAANAKAAGVTVDNGGGLPFHISTPISLRPVNVQITIPSGWKRDESYDKQPFNNSRYISVDKRQEDGKGRVMWTLQASASVELDDDQERAAALLARHKEEGQKITICGFTGSLFVTSSLVELPYTIKYSAEGLLKRGQVNLHVSYYIVATGHDIYDPDEKTKELVKVYAGAGDAQKAAKEALATVESVINGITLNPER